VAAATRRPHELSARDSEEPRSRRDFGIAKFPSGQEGLRECLCGQVGRDLRVGSSAVQKCQYRIDVPVVKLGKSFRVTIGGA
jgi:hypothetical protein